MDTSILEDLYESERALVARAVPKRQREFATGRVLARRCLRELNISSTPVLCGVHRQPLWPPGVVGSISHTNDYCAVAVAAAGDLLGVGIDIEDPEPLPAQLWLSILTKPELARTQGQSGARRGVIARAVFSARESVYKAIYPSGEILLDFRGVEIRWEFQDDAFTATINHPTAGQPMLDGRFLVNSSFICAGLVL